MSTENTSPSTSNLQKVTGALTQFKTVDAGIAALREKYAGVVYDCKTTEGFEEAKAARLAIRTPRYLVENIRKDAKAPILALGRELDAEAARITAALEKIEKPIDDQIKAEETRREEERQRKIREETERVQKIRDRIAALNGLPTSFAASPSQDIVVAIETLTHTPIDDSFAEFKEEAERAHGAALVALQKCHEAAVAREAEQRRVEAQLAELARLRAEQEAREKAEREAAAKREREEAERRAKEAAEQKRVADIRARIDGIRSLPTAYAGKPSDVVRLAFRDLREATSFESFAEFGNEARQAYAEALTALETEYQAALKREADLRELEQLRAERAAREEAEAKAAAEKAAAEQAEAAKRARIEAEEASVLAAVTNSPEGAVSVVNPQGTEETGIDRPAAPISAPPVDAWAPNYNAPPRPTSRQIIDLISMHYRVPRETAIGWLREMFAVRAA